MKGKSLRTMFQRMKLVPVLQIHTKKANNAFISFGIMDVANPLFTMKPVNNIPFRSNSLVNHISMKFVCPDTFTNKTVTTNMEGREMTRENPVPIVSGTSKYHKMILPPELARDFCSDDEYLHLLVKSVQSALREVTITVSGVNNRFYGDGTRVKNSFSEGVDMSEMYTMVYDNAPANDDVSKMFVNHISFHRYRGARLLTFYK